MAEYGVQTTNPFALLESADETAKPKVKAKRKKKSQRGPPKDPAVAPAAAKAAPLPATTVKKEAQPPKPAAAQSKPQASPSQPAKQPAGASPSQQQGRGQQQSQRNNNAGRGGAGSPGGRGRGNAPGQVKQQPAGNAQQQRQAPADPKKLDALAKRLDASAVSFEEKSDTNKGTGPRDHKDHVHKRDEPARSHGRQYDRHSGTGRPLNENKRGGSGPGNWGTADDELAAEEDLKVALQEQGTPAENKKKRKKKPKKKGEEESEEKKDDIPDENLKLYDDFLKEQKEKQVKLSLPKARAAGEGVKEDPAWAAAVKLEKSDDKSVFFKKEEAPEPIKESSTKSKSALKRERKAQAKREAQKKMQDDYISNIFDFSAKKEPSPGGRGRVPRGGRGGGNRGNRDKDFQPREGGNRQPREGRPARGGNTPQQAPKKFRVDDDAPQFDDSSFPALHVGPPAGAE